MLFRWTMWDLVRYTDSHWLSFCSNTFSAWAAQYILDKVYKTCPTRGSALDIEIFVRSKEGLLPLKGQDYCVALNTNYGWVGARSMDIKASSTGGDSTQTTVLSDQVLIFNKISISINLHAMQFLPIGPDGHLLQKYFLQNPHWKTHHTLMIRFIAKSNIDTWPVFNLIS